MRTLLAALSVIGLAACSAIPKEHPTFAAPSTDWRQVATSDDRARLREWRTAFTKALGQARKGGHAADIAREGRLLEPDAALGPVPIPNGRYKCRAIKLGAKSPGLLDYMAGSSASTMPVGGWCCPIPALNRRSTSSSSPPPPDPEFFMQPTALALIAASLLSTSATAATVGDAIKADMPQLMTLYRDLHANPELSMQEVRSPAKLAVEMKKLGFTVTEKVGQTGVVAVMKNGAGPTLMIRADMDGLPVVEQTGLPYASKVRATARSGVESGVMHACGHDTHMTAFIGTARRMAAMKGEWAGTLVMILQPGEETSEGASAMLADGLYTRFPKPNVALAFHDAASLPAGVIGVTPGYALANVDSVDISVRGVGGHGAYPQTTKDPIVLASRIVTTLQTLVSRTGLVHAKLRRGAGDQDPGGDGRRGFQPLLARRQVDREPDLLGRRNAQAGVGRGQGRPDQTPLASQPLLGARRRSRHLDRDRSDDRGGAGCAEEGLNNLPLPAGERALITRFGQPLDLPRA